MLPTARDIAVILLFVAFGLFVLFLPLMGMS